jgi:hypothetical protein
VDVNFCVQKANAVTKTGTGTAAVILPESGAAHNNLTTYALLVGGLLVFVGLALEWRRRAA